MARVTATAGGLLVGLAIAGACGSAWARDVRIVAADLPPMVLGDGSGREERLIGEALALCGHTAVFTVVPFGRHWSEYKGGGYDAVATVPPGLALPGFASRPYIRYQNGASVLVASGLSVHSLDDLAGKRVITFSGGTEILPGLKEAASLFADLRELADQLIHSNLLFARRVDAVLADGLIFAEYNRRLRERVERGDALPFDPTQDVAFTAIFPPSPYVMAFQDAALRDEFDRCSAELEAGGRAATINREAVEPYRGTVGDQYLHD